MIQCSVFRLFYVYMCTILCINIWLISQAVIYLKRILFTQYNQICNLPIFIFTIRMNEIHILLLTSRKLFIKSVSFGRLQTPMLTINQNVFHHLSNKNNTIQKKYNTLSWQGLVFVLKHFKLIVYWIISLQLAARVSIFNKKRKCFIHIQEYIIQFIYFLPTHLIMNNHCFRCCYYSFSS